ncbi:hypothetical protein [Pontibacillus marinus]|uniref:Uncharacterized protein n=1 Tax=Pontibacillus marinus BH030004 = DSM 16465 TaxID=1385511 RepID=A0A0A5G658_9BACI|nr:hypothetical protein [Pontibacillus marinus]KGX86663.1 hypothetical protein N783_11750 [Pontibacillus marinus BH030004 = DSM 16465]
MKKDNSLTDITIDFEGQKLKFPNMKLSEGAVLFYLESQPHLENPYELMIFEDYMEAKNLVAWLEVSKRTLSEIDNHIKDNCPSFKGCSHFNHSNLPKTKTVDFVNDRNEVDFSAQIINFENIFSA